MLLFTLDEFKNELGIDLSDTTKDDELNLTIERISGIVEGYLGYSLDQKTVTEYFDNGIVNFVALQKYITDTSSINIKGVSTSTEYTVSYFDGRLGYLSEPTGGEKLKIQYQTGYTNSDEIPADLKQVAISWGLKSYNNLILSTSGGSGDLKIKTKKLGSLSLTYFSPNEVSNKFTGGNDTSNGKPSDYKILDKYKISFIY